jgi:hypothetical protein
MMTLRKGVHSSVSTKLSLYCQYIDTEDSILAIDTHLHAIWAMIHFNLHISDFFSLIFSYKILISVQDRVL